MVARQLFWPPFLHSENNRVIDAWPLIACQQPHDSPFAVPLLMHVHCLTSCNVYPNCSLIAALTLISTADLITIASKWSEVNKTKPSSKHTAWADTAILCMCSAPKRRRGKANTLQAPGKRQSL